MNGKTSPPSSLAPASARPASRRWGLLAVLLLLLLAGGVGGALWWRGHAAPPLPGPTGPGSESPTTESQLGLAVCSDDDDPKYLDALEFGPPLEVPLDRRFLDALPDRPLPSLEVYPWQPRELVAILGEHRMRGNLVAASPDGKLLAVAQTGSPFVRIGEVPTLHEKVVLSCLPGVHALAWSPDGARLAVSCAANEVRCFNVSNLERVSSPLSLPRVTGLVTSLSFSADSKYLLGGDNTPKRGIAWVWSLADEKVVRQLRHTGPVAGVAFSPVPGDYRALTAGGVEDSQLRLWDAVAGTQQAAIDFSPPRKTDASTLGTVAFSPDGKQALSSHPDRAVRLWDLERFEKGKELLRLNEHDGNLPLACFSPDGRHVASARFKDGGIWLWDARTGKQVRRLAASGGVWALRFLGDGSRLVFAGTLGADYNVHVHEVETGTEQTPPRGHLTGLTDVSLAPAGQLVATGAHDATMRLWDLKDVSQRHVHASSGAPARVGFHPDGKRSYFFSTASPTFVLVDADSGKTVSPAYDKPHNGGILSAAVTRDGRYVVTGGYHDGTVRMARLKDGRQVRLFNLGNNQGPAMVTLAPDMRRALHIGGGKTRLLQLRCQRVLHEWPAVEWAPFLPDGRAAFFSGNKVPLWEITADGTKESGHIPLSQTGIGARDISANGKRMALVAGGRVAVYDLPEARLVWSWEPPPHFGDIAGVALAADGSHLLTANDDGTAYVIRLP